MAIHIRDNTASTWRTVKNISVYNGDTSSWVTAANAAIWDTAGGGSWVGFLDKITINTETVVTTTDDIGAAAQWALDRFGNVIRGGGEEYLWCQNPNNTAFYEAAVTWTWTNQNGGSFTGETGNNVSLGIEDSRRYICSRGNVGQSEGNLTVEIRNIATGQTFGPATITLRAIRNS
jgi:hypothetical protein